eukprot:14073233-Alexandrium_andersonii.AAC.1
MWCESARCRRGGRAGPAGAVPPAQRCAERLPGGARTTECPQLLLEFEQRGLQGRDRVNPVGREQLGS